MTDTRAVRQLFDELAPGYDEELPFFATFGQDLVDWAQLQPGDRVLDVAAGRGAITSPAAHAVGESGEVLAVDNAPRMLELLARDLRHLPQVRTRVMDAQQLDLPDGRFDAVMCGFVLHFLDDPAAAISETFRVLRPGGRLLFSGPPQRTVPDDEPPDERWAFYGDLMREMGGRAAAAGNQDMFTPPPRPLPDICHEAGFTDMTDLMRKRSFRLDDPEHYWRWQMSHGFRGFVDPMPAPLAAELRERVLSGLQPLHEDGGIELRMTIGFVSLVKPVA